MFAIGVAPGIGQILLPYRVAADGAAEAEQLVIAGVTVRATVTRIEVLTMERPVTMSASEVLRVPRLPQGGGVGPGDRLSTGSAVWTETLVIAVHVVSLTFAFKEPLVANRTLAAGTDKTVQMPGPLHGLNIGAIDCMMTACTNGDVDLS